VLGVAILDRDVWLPALTDSSVSSQRYRDARAKVKVIFILNGRLFRCRIPHSCYYPPPDGKGVLKEVAKPTEPSQDEVIRTYKELAEPILKRMR